MGAAHEQEKKKLEEQFGPAGALEGGKTGLSIADVLTGPLEVLEEAGKLVKGPGLAAGKSIGKVGGYAGAAVSAGELIHDLTRKGGPSLEAVQHGADLGFSLAGLYGGPMGAVLSAGYSLGGLIDTATGATKGGMGGLSGLLAKEFIATDPALRLREAQHREEMKSYEKHVDEVNRQRTIAQLQSIATGGATEEARAKAREELLKHGVGAAP